MIIALLALLALLGIPAWFVLGVFFTALHQRKAVLERDDIFRYRVRTDTGWARRKGVGRWVSDVLVRHRGIALVRTDIDPVDVVEFSTIAGDRPKGFGNDAVEIQLTLVGEGPLRIAVPADSLERALGPPGLRQRVPGEDE